MSVIAHENMKSKGVRASRMRSRIGSSVLEVSPLMLALIESRGRAREPRRCPP